MAEVVDLEGHVSISGTERAAAKLKAFDTTTKRVFANMSQSTSSTDRAMSLLGKTIGVMKFPAMAAGAGLATSAIGALGAATVGLSGALAPAVGLIGALPGGMLMAAQGAGALTLAFQGVGDALKAYTAKDEQAARMSAQLAKTTQSEARAREAATKGVERAQDALAKAQKAVGKSAVEAAADIEDAEARVAAAQRTALRAQEALNDARRRAKRELEDLSDKVEQLGLDERKAALELKEAREAVRTTNRDADATANDREAANIRLRQAEINLREVTEDRAEATAKLAEEQVKGVEGSDAVTEALARQKDAQDDVKEMQKDLKSVVADAAEKGVEATERVADAQEALADALDKVNEVAERQGALGPMAMEKFRQAMEDLTPEGRAMVEQLKSMAPIFDGLRQTAQKALFPGLIRALQTMTPLFGALEGILGRTAGLFGNLAAKMAAAFSSNSFIERLVAVADQNMPLFTNLANAFINVANGFVNVAIAAKPLTDYLGQLTEWFSKMFENWSKSEGLPTFFERVRDTVAKLVSIAGDLWQTFKNVFEAARPLSDWLMNGLVKGVDALREFTGSAEGMSRIREYLESFKPVLEALGPLLKGLGGIFVEVGMASNDALAQIIRDLTSEFLPVLKEVLLGVTKALGPEMVDLLVEVARMFGTLVSSGALTTFVSVLADILKLVNDLVQEHPNLGKFIGLMMLVGPAMAAFKAATILTGFATVSRVVSSIAGGLATMQQLGGVTGTLAAKFPTLTLLAHKFGDGINWGITKMVNFIDVSGRWVADTAAKLAHHAAEAAKWAGRMVVSFAKVIGKGAVWAATAIADIVKVVAKTIWGTAVMVAKWAWMGVQALIHAAKVALAWFIALGPVGWAIAAVIAVAGIVIYYWDEISNAMDELWQSFQVGWDIILGAIGGAVRWIRDALGRAWDWMAEPVIRAVRGVWDAITGTFTSILNWFRELPGRLLGFLSGLYEDMRRIGSNILIGLWNGLVAGWDAFKRLWNGLIDLIPGGLADFLKIRSPSRVMMSMGEQIGAGLAIGISNSAPAIRNAVSGLGSAIPSQFSSDFRMAATASSDLGTSQAVMNGGMKAPPMRHAAGDGGTTIVMNVEGSVIRETELFEKARTHMVRQGQRNVSAFGGTA